MQGKDNSYEYEWFNSMNVQINVWRGKAMQDNVIRCQEMPGADGCGLER
jgi:hypothetical protein